MTGLIYNLFGRRIYAAIAVASVLCLSAIASAETDSAARRSDPNAFRLFLAPTSMTLRENHGTLQLAELSIPAVNYGIVDEFIVRAGVTPFSISSHNLFYALAGLQIFDYSGFSGVGGIVATNATGESRGWERSLYGFGVIGYTVREFGIYGGFGGGYSATRESSTAVLMLGGEYSVSAHNKLISENWFATESATNSFSIGLRTFGALLSFDLAVVALTEAHSMKISTVVPWVSLSYHFDLTEE